MRHFAIFGSHPRLSLAEFLAVQSDISPPLLTGPAALFDETSWDGRALMRTLGGTVKLGDVLGVLNAEDLTGESAADLVADILPKTSMDFGWTVYGGSHKQNEKLTKIALGFKKALKARGIPSRWVTGKDGETISPAAVTKLNLTTKGLDLCLFLDEQRVHIGRTTHVQDADAWSLRDFGRPARDEIVGMLPPKLARMMVNLARTPTDGTLLDPFCGGGTVLMEAALATNAKAIIGSDIDATQVANAKKNLDWLVRETILNADTTTRVLLHHIDVKHLDRVVQPPIDAVVTEGHLGPPLTGQETKETLERNAKDIAALWQDALRVLRPLCSSNARLVCIWPAFKSSHGTARVDLTDALPSLGFELVNPLRGVDESNDPLLYSRAGQRVMRRIVILKRLD